MQVAIATRARNDAAYCGDVCGYWHNGGETTLCVVDGLGHGKDAEQAARAAVEYVASHLSTPLREIFAGCDRALRRTRGGAMSIAVINEKESRLTYAGIGNTRAMIVGEKAVRLRNDYDIVGAGIKNVSCTTMPLVPGDLVLLFTDGLTEWLDPLVYSDTLRANLQRLAEQIIQDWRCGTDDAAVLIYRKEMV